MKVDPSDVRRVRPDPHAAALVLVYRMGVPPPHVGDEFVWEGKRFVMTQMMWPGTGAFGAVVLFSKAAE